MFELPHRLSRVLLRASYQRNRLRGKRRASEFEMAIEPERRFLERDDMRLVIAAVALLVTPPVLAQDDPTNCQFAGTWEGVDDRNPTVLIIRQNQEQFDDDDSILVAVFNDDWSIASGETIGRVKVANEDGAWLDNDAIAMNHGFAIWTHQNHLQNVIGYGTEALSITRNGKTIDRLKFTSFLSEWMAFDRCRNKKVAAKAEKDRQAKLMKEIPKDPFQK